MQHCFMRFKSAFFIVLLVRGKQLKMGTLLTTSVCTTSYVLQVTISCVHDKNEGLKLPSGRVEDTGILLWFCCRSVG